MLSRLPCSLYHLTAMQPATPVLPKHYKRRAALGPDHGRRVFPRERTSEGLVPDGAGSGAVWMGGQGEGGDISSSEATAPCPVLQGRSLTVRLLNQPRTTLTRGEVASDCASVSSSGKYLEQRTEEQQPPCGADAGRKRLVRPFWRVRDTCETWSPSPRPLLNPKPKDIYRVPTFCHK